MKKIKVILFAATISLLASCDTDITQPGELYPEDTFQTVTDLEYGLNGVYGAVGNESEIKFNSVFTDEVSIGFANGGQGLNDGSYLFTLNTNSSDAYAIWQGNYSLINRANRVIEAARKITPDPTIVGEVEKYKSIVAQCHILRAFGHFKLLTYFSPDLTDDEALGCIIMKRVPTIYEQLPRSKNVDVFQFIEEDLAFETDVIDYPTANKKNLFVSMDMITAFRARMAAYRGHYQDALDYADELIGKYNLTPRNPTGVTNSAYLNIWRDTPINPLSNDEVIFKLERDQNDSKVGSIWASNDATISGSPFYEMSTDLYKLLYNPARSYAQQVDIRANAFIHPSSDFANNIILIGKYTGDTSNPLLNDIKIFRLSEMYFIKAEALVGLNRLSEARDVLQAVNNVRYRNLFIPTVAFTTATEAWNEILKQRRMELCFEGHRWVDLKRLGIPSKANYSIDRDDADCLSYGACELSNTSDFMKALPIPQTELNANKEIVQNPGYN